MFSVDSELNLFESYCETWARTINHLYYSLLLNDDGDMKILSMYGIRKFIFFITMQ